MANKIFMIELNGISVGIIGVTNVSNFQFKKEDSCMLARPDKIILKEILKLMDTCDYKIIFYHGDLEYNFVSSKNKIDFARWCIDNGFDIFIGHHPHIIQPIEIYKNGIIFYSLGNFAFRQKIKGIDKGLFTIFEFYVDSFNIKFYIVKADYFPEIIEDNEEIDNLKNYNNIKIEEISKGFYRIGS